jgi:hypothetical protein
MNARGSAVVPREALVLKARGRISKARGRYFDSLESAWKILGNVRKTPEFSFELTF